MLQIHKIVTKMSEVIFMSPLAPCWATVTAEMPLSDTNVESYLPVDCIFPIFCNYTGPMRFDVITVIKCF